MKKIISLFIIFLFLFNLFPYSFAMETKSIDINSFDEFSVEQVQNTFSDNLTQEKNSNTKSDQDTNAFLFSNTMINCNISDFLSADLKQQSSNLFSYDFDFCRLNNYLYRNKLFEKKCLTCGIGEYKINQNTYMAVALFDSVNFVYIHS